MFEYDISDEFNTLSAKFTNTPRAEGGELYDIGAIPQDRRITAEQEQVTNDEFLAAIFGRIFADTSPLVCSKPGNPDLGGWNASRWPCPTNDHSRNWYCLPSLIRPDSTGRQKATKDLAQSVHALMLDDIGTKVDPNKLLGITPSWIIETSPGNHQVGFILYPPVTDLPQLERLKSALIERGLCDPGASGVSTRWMRLPNGINGRPKYGQKPFSCRLIDWNPLKRYSFKDLQSVLVPSLGNTPTEVATQLKPGRSDLTTDSILAALHERGLYKKELGNGKHDITCPWVHEHTNQIDNGSAYFEPSAAYPQGGFRCHHSHGSRLHIAELEKYLQVPRSQPTVSGAEVWPEPAALPSQLLPVPNLTAKHLPKALRAGVEDIAERIGCPLEYVAIPTLVGAGIVLGNQVGLWPKQHDESWVVYTGFWGGIVGEPGTMKTPALNAAFAPLYAIERREIDGYRQALAKYHSDKKAYEKALSDFKQGKNTNIPAEPTEPLKPRLIVNDSTYQALGEILSANPRGVLALADELSGLLQGLDTAGQEQARGFYLSGWGGAGNYTFDRVTRGTVCLTNYMLAVFGGFQPARIGAYVQFAQGANSKNDGLLQRFQLLVWPNILEDFTGVDRPEDQNALKTMSEAVENLRDIHNRPELIKSKRGKEKLCLHFDEQAQQLFNEWFHKHEQTLRKSDLDSSLHSHFSKYRSLIPGLALLFHLLEGHNGGVCRDCLNLAIDIGDYLKAHAMRVYASVNGTDRAPARALAKKLLNKELQDGFTARSVYTKGWRDLGTPEKVRTATELLTELGWLEEASITTGGRTKTAFYINPKISEDLL